MNGKKVPLIEQGGGMLKLGETPIGPTWDLHHYFLGADARAATSPRGSSTADATRSLIGIGSAVIAA